MVFLPVLLTREKRPAEIQKPQSCFSGVFAESSSGVSYPDSFLFSFNKAIDFSRRAASVSGLLALFRKFP
jgi:hypothetical protein